MSRKVCAKPQMSYILTNVRVTVATSDVQSIVDCTTMVLNKLSNDTFNRLAGLARQQLQLSDIVTSSLKNISSIR